MPVIIDLEADETPDACSICLGDLQPGWDGSRKIKTEQHFENKRDVSKISGEVVIFPYGWVIDGCSFPRCELE